MQTQRDDVHSVLNNDEFAPQPPRQIVQTLLERRVTLYSASTMHRMLREHGERREQRVAQRHAKPRLVACVPNEVWTWDCVRHEALSERWEVDSLQTGIEVSRL